MSGSPFGGRSVGLEKTPQLKQLKRNNVHDPAYYFPLNGNIANSNETLTELLAARDNRGLFNPNKVQELLAEPIAHLNKVFER